MSDLQTLQQKLAFAEKLLTGVAMANNALINAENYRESIQQSLEILGNSTEVDRVYIFKCHHHETTGDPLMSQRWEWVAPGIPPEIDNPELQNLSFNDFFSRWYQELSIGQEIAGLIEDFPDSEREILEPQNILSIVVVPIAVRAEFWGFMGFDDCHRGRLWSPSEINALKTVANSFGGAFARQAAETALRQVNETLEARIQQRTAELEASTALANQANQAKSDFLASMSHELRTPLNGILGYAQILQRSGDLQPQELAHASIIEQCGQHLLTLINEVLDLSKIESRKMDLYPAEVRVESFMQAIIEMFSIQAHQKGIAFRHNLDPALPKGIWVDKKRLRQVLFNLISNAIKFTEQGSVELYVTSEPEIQSLETEAPTQYQIRFEVHDTGSGISKPDIEKIFSPFEQVGDMEMRSKGTGLGLAISQQIVLLMGGELKVESSLGKGSQFSFEICCPEVDLKHLPDLSLANRGVLGYQGAARTILVVDDRWENRAVLVNMLEPLGFKLCEAENGIEGLEKVQAEKPDLIITDLSMPMMDGYDLIRRLRQRAETHKTPIFVSSASVLQSDQQRSLEIGGDYFLPKPILLKELIHLLEESLNLEWIYEDIPLGTSASVPDNDSENLPVNNPPKETLIVLQKLARSGLINAFCKELSHLENTSKKYKGFTQEYRKLANSFQLKALQDSLEATITEQTSTESIPQESTNA